jgi:sialidase-1
MLNIRTESPELRRAVAYSADGATGWTVPVFDEQLYEPICMGSIERVTEQPAYDRNRIIFVNPDSRHVPKKSTSWAGSRENLSIKLSYDEGETWAVDKVLDSSFSGYSDLAVGPDKTMYCFYERGGIGDSAFQPRRLTLARFNLAWLTDGRDAIDQS